MWTPPWDWRRQPKQQHTESKEIKQNQKDCTRMKETKREKRFINNKLSTTNDSYNDKIKEICWNNKINKTTAILSISSNTITRRQQQRGRQQQQQQQQHQTCKRKNGKRAIRKTTNDTNNNNQPSICLGCDSVRCMLLSYVQLIS